MTNRAIAFLGLYSLATLAAFVFPPAGVWGFLFESNYHPPYNKWWGAPLMTLGDRWSFYIGAVMALAVLLYWGRYKDVSVMNHPQSWMLVLFTLNSCLVTLWAYDVNASWKEASDNLKWLLVYWCIVKTHSDRRWLPMIIFIYIFAAIDFSWDTTINPPGGRGVRGGPVTASGDENFVAPHVIALLPFALTYAVSSNIKWWLRLSFGIAAPLMLNLVAHASSRGAFIALIVTAVAMLVFSRGRMRTLVIFGVIAGACLGARLFHEQFWRRMGTIQSHEDGAATGRVEAWKDAWELACRNPFGYGAEAFDRGLRKGTVSTHNMYFECLVAWGFQGTLLFLAYLFFTIRDCWRLKRRLWQGYQWPPPREYLDAFSLCVALCGMLAAAVFVNRIRWELWWVYGAYAVCLKNVCVSVPGTVPTAISQSVEAAVISPRFREGLPQFVDH